MSRVGKNHETDFSAQMTALAEANEQLRDTDGFLVESSEGDIGWVEEIWVGEANEPRALAVQTRVAVEHEQRWVVVPPQPTLLELAPPHLTKDGRDGSGIRMTASWATTGAPIAAPTRRSWRWRLRSSRPRSAAVPREQERAERPLWQVIVVLYASLAFTVVFVIALAFAIARLVSGAAY